MLVKESSELDITNTITSVVIGDQPRELPGKTAAGDVAGLVFTAIYFVLFMLSKAKQLPAGRILTTSELKHLVYIVAAVMLISTVIEI